jgi:hypothetical protein
MSSGGELNPSKGALPGKEAQPRVSRNVIGVERASNTAKRLEVFNAELQIRINLPCSSPQRNQIWTAAPVLSLSHSSTITLHQSDPSLSERLQSSATHTRLQLSSGTFNIAGTLLGESTTVVNRGLHSLTPASSAMASRVATAGSSPAGPAAYHRPSTSGSRASGSKLGWHSRTDWLPRPEACRRMCRDNLRPRDARLF